jgi:hypothetical protein
MIRYYDDLLTEKLLRWLPENSRLRILKPDETKRLFETMADDKNDAPLKLPLIALSRSNDLNLDLNIKNLKSFSGVKIYNSENLSSTLNAIPVSVNYQMDIYTKTMDEGDEYLRSFLFKIINNPKMIITIPYTGFDIQHVVYIRVQGTISETSNISERIFSGQFTRWTLQLELQDAYLFNIPYKKNWKLDSIGLEMSKDVNLACNEKNNLDGSFEGEITPE